MAAFQTTHGVLLNDNRLLVTDSRTGKDYELEVSSQTIRALDLRLIRKDPKEFGMLSYDPGYTNTASCTSNITFIDGGKGILRYRGYAVEELAAQCSFTEVAYLLLRGELPDTLRTECLEPGNHGAFHGS